MSKLKILLTLLAVMFLSNCATGLLLFNSGDGNPISGKQVGVSRPENIVDFRDIRVRLSPVVSARNFPIPTTYAFLYSWTPEAYNRQNAEKGRRQPTEQDWNDQAARSIRAGINPAYIPKIIRYQKKMADRSEFKAYVAPNGLITRCNESEGGKYGCTIGLTLNQSVKMQLATKTLAALKPNCKIAQIDPAEVLALHPGRLRSGPLSIIASLDCS